MATLPDGTYDVIVVDADNIDGGDFRIELTVTLGPHVGRLVALRSRHVDDTGFGSDASALLGIPGTLRVHNGQPSFRPER